MAFEQIAYFFLAYRQILALQPDKELEIVVQCTETLFISINRSEQLTYVNTA